MASNREERFLSRQRGAGRHLDNDFGFDLAVPVSAGRKRQTPRRSLIPGSARRSKTPTLQAPESAKQTPQSRGPGRPRTSGPNLVTINETADVTTADGSTLPALETPLAAIVAPPADGLASEFRAAAGQATPSKLSSGKKRKKRKSIGQRPKGHSRRSLSSLFLQSPAVVEAERDDDILGDDSLEPGGVDETANDAAQSETVEAPAEGAIARTSQASSPKRKRQSIVQRVKKRLKIGRTAASPSKRTQTEILREHAEEQDDELEIDRPRSTIKRPRLSLRQNRPQVKHSGTVAAVSTEDGTAPSKKRGRPRKCMEAQNSSNIERAARQAEEPMPVAKKRGRPSRASLAAIEEEEEAADPLPVKQKQGSNRKKGRLSREGLANNEEIEAGPQPSGEEPEKAAPRARGRPRRSDGATSVADKSSGVAGKGRKRQPSPSHDEDNEDDGDDDSPAHVRRNKDAVPISVYRMSHASSFDFKEGEDDDLAGPGSFLKKKAVTAVDVLAQISREIIGKSLDKLKTGMAQEQDPVHRKELRQEKMDVELYGNELDKHLQQLAFALDHHHSLSRALKDATKEEKQLTDELLELQQQREELALRTDEVRREWEEEQADVQEEDDIYNMMHDIELAVKKGRAAEAAAGDEVEELSLEVGIRNIADNASSAEGRHGLLDSVKGFNALLERAIAVT